jgi:hypothetical protein
MQQELADDRVRRQLADFNELLASRRVAHLSPIQWNILASWDDEKLFLGYRP